MDPPCRLLEYFSGSPRTKTKIFMQNVNEVFQYINLIIKNKTIKDLQCIKGIFLLAKTFIKYEDVIDPIRITKIFIAIAERIDYNLNDIELKDIKSELIKIIVKRGEETNDANIKLCIEKLLNRNRINTPMNSKIDSVLCNNFINVQHNKSNNYDNDIYMEPTNVEYKINKTFKHTEIEINKMITKLKKNFTYNFKYEKEEIQFSLSNDFITENYLILHTYFIIPFPQTKNLLCELNNIFSKSESYSDITLFENDLSKQIDILPQMKYIYKYFSVRNYLKTKTELQKILIQKNETAVTIISLYFIILSHIFLAEYYEAMFYINKALKITHTNLLSFMYTFFFDIKFTLERMDNLYGPSTLYNFDKYFIGKFNQSFNFYDLNHKYMTNRFLCSDISIKREIRTINKKILPSKELLKILDCFPTFIFISCYTFENNLCFNIFSCKFENKCNHFCFDLDFIEVLKEFDAILTESNSTLKGFGNLDVKEWWNKRFQLNHSLSLLLNRVNSKFEKSLSQLNKNIFLICDEVTTNFPFESIAIFKDSSIYRIPSFEFLLKKHEDIPKTQKIKKIFYLLDPERNLQKSQERISDYFKNSFVNKLNIKGVTGRNLTESEWREAFSSDLFLYFGHGSGKKHIPKNFKQMLKNNNVFLFGCSSSKLLCHKNFKRNGQAMEYLNKVNTFIGCLWDVTDRDLDIFAMGLLDRIFNMRESINISEIFKESIKSMKLRYLNGSAIVMWGYPTIFTI